MKIQSIKQATKRLALKIINYRLVQEFLSEFIGTLVLVCFGCGGSAQIILQSKDINYDHLSISIAWGFGAFFGLILSVNITGYLNPAITFSMFVLKKISFTQLIVFTAGQYIGILTRFSEINKFDLFFS
jgi:aquaglyceroporin related protein